MTEFRWRLSDLQLALFGVALLSGAQLDGHAGPVAVADGVLHQRQRRTTLERRQDHELGVAVHVLLCGDRGHATDGAGPFSSVETEDMLLTLPARSPLWRQKTRY